MKLKSTVRLLSAAAISSFFIGTSAIAEISYAEALNLYMNVFEGKVDISDLTQEEIIALQALMSIQSSQELEDELGFSFRDVERRCDVDVDSDFDIDCYSNVRIIERKCTAHASGTTDGYFSCRGSELRPIERKCSFDIESGDIDC